MITFLKGVVSEKGESVVALDVHGVGYVVSVPENEMARFVMGSEVLVYTYLAVKEDALDLYGSLNKETVVWFKLLLHVKGVGPKSALSIMSRARPEDLSAAIEHESSDSLVALGIGKKAAERIVLELKTKARNYFIEGSASAASLSIEAEAMQALEALGYSRDHARDAVKKASGDDVGSLVRSALKQVGGS